MLAALGPSAELSAGTAVVVDMRGAGTTSSAGIVGPLGELFDTVEDSTIYVHCVNCCESIIRWTNVIANSEERATTE